jgi:hypothetical protein
LAGDVVGVLAVLVPKGTLHAYFSSNADQVGIWLLSKTQYFATEPFHLCPEVTQRPWAIRLAGTAETRFQSYRTEHCAGLHSTTDDTLKESDVL